MDALIRSPIAGIALAVLVLLPVAARAAEEKRSIHRGTIALDYRNDPDIASLEGYEYVALSPRATDAVQTLFRSGSKILYWMQPFVCTWQGAAPSPAYFQGAVHRLAEKHDAYLEAAPGRRAEIYGDDISDCWVLDFRNREFALALAELVLDRFSGSKGILFDYGCADLSWESSITEVDASVWSEWAEGYRDFREQIRREKPDWLLLCQCDRWTGWLPDVCNGLVLEKVGWSLNPFPKVWETVREVPSTNVLLYYEGDEPNPQSRRVAAAIAYLTDNLFAYRHATTGMPRRDPEHFEIRLGRFEEPLSEVRTNVYRRQAEFGFVLLNLSDKPYSFGEESLAPGDAVIRQTRDPGTTDPASSP